jgi:hypothetical protein
LWVLKRFHIFINALARRRFGAKKRGVELALKKARQMSQWPRRSYPLIDPISLRYRAKPYERNSGKVYEDRKERKKADQGYTRGHYNKLKVAERNSDCISLKV